MSVNNSSKMDDSCAAERSGEPPPPKLRNKSKQHEFRDNLIGGSMECIPTSKIPTKRLILQRARYLRDESTLNREISTSGDISDKEIADTVAAEVHLIWNKALLPCVRKDNIAIQVKKIMDELRALMKNWARLKPESKQLQSYSSSLDHLFDVSHTDLHYRLSISGNPEWKNDWKFYLDQKKVPQVGSMGGRDKLFEARQRRQLERSVQFEARKERAAQPSHLRQRSAAASTSNTTVQETEDCDSGAR